MFIHSKENISPLKLHFAISSYIFSIWHLECGYFLAAPSARFQKYAEGVSKAGLKQPEQYEIKYRSGGAILKLNGFNIYCH